MPYDQLVSSMEACALFHGMSNEEYHNHPALSKSGLDLIHRSLAHYLAPRPEPTLAMKEGTAFHTLILEPGSFEERYAVLPEVDRRTRAGKSAWERFQQEHAGKEHLSAETLERLYRMRDALQEHPSASALLHRADHHETSIFWKEQGLECKCRPDALCLGRREDETVDTAMILDLKSTQDASPEGFGRSAAQFRYHVQGAWYARGVAEALCLDSTPAFVLIAVEKNPPFNVGVYNLTEIEREQGWRQAQADLKRYRTYLETPESERWAGYSQLVERLQLPAWALQEGS
jgi:hypothetical protein